MITGGFNYTIWPIHEKYDSSTGIFSLTGAQSGSWESTATLLMNGNILVTYRYGSIIAVDGVVSRVFGTAELYDPASETFTAADNVTTDFRIGHTATLLSDGKVLLVGGCGCETGANLFSADAYLFDPAKGTFGNTGSMHANRWGHTATLLNDGRVLIAGGSTFLGTITPDGAAAGMTDTVSSAEVYTPAVLSSPPALLSLSGDGKGQGTILHAGTHHAVSPDNPASPGEPLEIYLTGLTDGSVIPPQVAESRFGRRPGLFSAFVAGQESLEIDAVKLAPSIQHDNLGQPPVTAHAFSENHHAGAITGRVEGRIECEDALAEGVDQKSHPRPSENLASVRGNHLHIQLCVIDVPDLEWTVPMPGRLEVELVIEGLLNICRSSPLPLQRLPIACSAAYRQGEGFVTTCLRSRMSHGHRAPHYGAGYQAPTAPTGHKLAAF